MRLIRVKWGKFLLELPGEIALFWLFKVLLLIHKLNESPSYNPWAGQTAQGLRILSAFPRVMRRVICRER